MLAEFNSMTDYSTTAGWIPILYPGSRWARRQLRNGINYVPVATKPRISLSSVEGGLGTMLADHNSFADSSTTA